MILLLLLAKIFLVLLMHGNYFLALKRKRKENVKDIVVQIKDNAECIKRIEFNDTTKELREKWEKREVF